MISHFLSIKFYAKNQSFSRMEISSSEKSSFIPSNLNSYKYCFVPNCKNTSARNPEKEFISVPKNELKRKLCCEAVGYEKGHKLKKNSYCCEDYFNVRK